MTTLLELKEKMVRFYGKSEVYVIPVLRFIVAFVTFTLINENIGYMTSINRMPIALILALLCAVLPMNGTIVLAAVVILAHFYALSLEVCLVALVLFLIIYFLYFRFAPKCGYNALFTPVLLKLQIPYIVPIGSGLLNGAHSVISVICGCGVYFFINGVKANAAMLGDTVEEGESVTSKFVVVLNQFLGNKEMYLVTLVLAVTTLIVYIVRRMDIDNAWRVAWISGLMFETLGLIAGYMMLGISGKTVSVLTGTVISGILAFIIEFLFCGLNYSRTERLQFEDDEYYYYVKAVPKATVTIPEKTVKRINERQKTGVIDSEQVLELERMSKKKDDDSEIQRIIDEELKND